jgi:co-chaperonin GroES (HSP10)
MGDAKPLERTKNMPSIDMLKPQGLNRFIAKMHENAEYKTASGLVIPNAECTQDVPTTGDVVALSPVFGEDDKGRLIYPDVKIGQCVKVSRNGWTPFTVEGVWYALGDARNIIGAYDPDRFCQ